MQTLFAIANRNYRMLDVGPLQSGNIVVHNQLYRILFPALIKLVKEMFDYTVQADKLVHHAFIKYWLRCANLNSIEEVEGFFYITLRSCYLARKQFDAIQKEILQEILRDAIRKGQSRDELLASLDNITASEKEEAKEVFNMIYNKAISLQTIATEGKLPVQVIQQRLLLAKQILHAILFQG